MPRIARGETAGGIYHIINRGNMRMRVFDAPGDYDYFLDLLKEGKKKAKIDIHAYCLMPNHFHLLVVLRQEKSLSAFMQWVMTSHVRHYHKKNRTSGHLWQGRYKSFIVQQESYYLTLMRYIEANALRARLVKDASEWPYGSLYERLNKNRKLLSDPYSDLDDHWAEHVNKPIYPKELAKIRNSVNRQAPLGEEQWQMETAAKLGLMSTLNRRGRPKGELERIEK